MLHEAGILEPIRPDKALKIGATFLRWGASPAIGVATAAIHHPHEIALIDERGSLSFERLHRRTNALAHSFATMGIGYGDGVGIMCRNHRGFVEATLAAAKLGASALYLNTMFAGPQLAEVTRREEPKALVYDAEFAGLLEGVDDSVARIVAWHEEGEVAGETTLEQLIAAGSEADLRPPPDKPRFVILTSGTTGTPKGAQRSSPDGLLAIAALLDKIPFRSRETMMIAAPLFHSWGFFHFIMSLPTASTMVLRRRFDPEGTLQAVQESRAEVLAAVPVMIQRILALPDETLAAYDLSSLRITSLSGSALPGELAIEWMDRFGDNVYNLYGSTEVAYATVATPEDLRAAPGTAGKPPRGTTVRILDEDGQRGAAGRGRPHLRRQRDVLRGLHRRRRQGGDRRPALQRRRRPHRRRRPALHRRPRRRDDRLRRRERLPARGRGPARRPRGGGRGRGDRRRGRRVRPAAEGLRRRSGPGSRSPKTSSRPTSRPTSPATRRRARSSSSTSCRATPPARSSSATCTRARRSSPPERSLRANCGRCGAPQPACDASGAHSRLRRNERSSEAAASRR